MSVKTVLQREIEVDGFFDFYGKSFKKVSPGVSINLSDKSSWHFSGSEKVLLKEPDRMYPDLEELLNWYSQYEEQCD